MGDNAVPCVVCGGNRTYSPLDGKWKCVSCTHTWLSVSKDSAESFHSDHETWRYKKFDIRDSYVAKRKQLIVGALGGQPGSVLDVGCGDCSFLASMGGAKRRVGIECNESSAPLDGIEYVRGFFPGDCPAGTFDAVTSFHSLEHIPDCVGALRCMVEHAERLVAIEVPVFRRLWSFPGSRDGHFHGFSVKSLKALVSKHAKEMKTVSWTRNIQGSSALWIGVRK